jgi:hypothetical protein
MNRVALAVLAVPAIAASVVIGPTTAAADTETKCGVTHAEWDNMQAGLTVNQVYNRFDVYGVYIDDTENRFRRGYRTCWAPGSVQAVVVFSYDTGESVNWYTRDV